MFPARYFPNRYFAPRYWPKVGQTAPAYTVLRLGAARAGAVSITARAGRAAVSATAGAATITARTHLSEDA